MAALGARRAPRSGRRGGPRASRRVGARIAFHEWVQWSARPAAGAAAGRAAAHQRPAGRRRARRLRRLGVAGPVRPRREHRACRRIGSTWRARTGACRRWSRTGSAPAGYRPSSRPCGRSCAMPAGCGSTTCSASSVSGGSRAGFDPTRAPTSASPTDELLAVLAIESARAGALVIGEDLGTVPRGVRTAPRAGRCRCRPGSLYFERRPPGAYPRAALAAVSTHDLPTLAGLWTGSDLEDQAAAGHPPDPAELAALRRRVQRAERRPHDAASAVGGARRPPCACRRRRRARRGHAGGRVTGRRAAEHARHRARRLAQLVDRPAAPVEALRRDPFVARSWSRRSAADGRVRRDGGSSPPSGGSVSVRRGRLPVPRLLDRLHAAEIADVRPAVCLGIRVEDLVPAAGDRQPDPVAGTRQGRQVHDHGQPSPRRRVDAR